MTQIYRSPIEFTNFGEIRVSLTREYEISRERRRATTRFCDILKHFDNEVTKSSYTKRACDERAGNDAQTRTTFQVKTTTAFWPGRRATPCGQRRADENEILFKKAHRAQAISIGRFHAGNGAQTRTKFCLKKRTARRR